MNAGFTSSKGRETQKDSIKERRESRMRNTLRNLNDRFSHFIGTQNYYVHFSRGFVFTDGVKAVADQYQAYWLIDVIASHQTNKKIRTKYFQIWTIFSTGDKAFIEMRPDSDQPVLVKQHIPFTDFPEGMMTMYYIDDGSNKVLLLPSEY
jgi:hypothetical protein